MARVQLVMPEADRDRFVDQARREGMSLSAWLRAAARERLETRQRVKLFQSPEDVKTTLAGRVNVAAEWTMLATAFNLRTLWRAWRSRAFIQLPHGPNLHPAS